jgi:hypothetical protein
VSGPTHQRALTRLRTEDRFVDTLAAMVVRDFANTPLRDLVTAPRLAARLDNVLVTLTESDTLHTTLEHHLTRLHDRISADERTLRQVLPEEIRTAVSTLLAHPIEIPAGMAQRIVRQKAVRDLVSSVLEEAMSSFGRGLRATDGRLGGLGRRAASQGRAFGKGLLAAAGVADVASGLAHTVSEEIEAAFERRIKDFIGEATARALEQIVGHLSGPDSASSFADFRVALFEELLNTPVGDLATVLDATQAREAADAVIAGLKPTGEASSRISRWEELIQAWIDEIGDQSLDAWMAEAGLTESWEESATPFIAQRLKVLVSTDDFATWWASLFDA